MSSFKASKEKQILLLGLLPVVTKLKPVLIYHFSNPKALGNYTSCTLCGLTMEQESLFTTWFIEEVKLLKLTTQEK